MGYRGWMAMLILFTISAVAQMANLIVTMMESARHEAYVEVAEGKVICEKFQAEYVCAKAEETTLRKSEQ